MKKTFKKIIATVLMAAFAASFSTMSVGAYNIGDIINYAQPTDIIATINGYPLMSFNVDGFTYVIAEDLKHYGFTVNYDNTTRSLAVERNSAVTAIAPHNTNAALWNIGSNKTSKNILYTDIVVYVANHYVPGYNIDGATIIKFDELARFGVVSYDDAKREISLTVSDIAFNMVPITIPFSTEEKVTLYALDGRTIDVSESEVVAYLNVGWYKTLAETQQTMYAPDGRTITVYKSEVPAYKNVGWFETKSQAIDSNRTKNYSSNSNNSSADGNYYRTPTGKRYHLDPDCGGKNSYKTTNLSGLTPCAKCAK